MFWCCSTNFGIPGPSCSSAEQSMDHQALFDVLAQTLFWQVVMLLSKNKGRWQQLKVPLPLKIGSCPLLWHRLILIANMNTRKSKNASFFSTKEIYHFKTPTPNLPKIRYTSMLGFQNLCLSQITMTKWDITNIWLKKT